MREIIGAVVDEGSFFETGQFYGRSAITGLARLDGWPVAILAGDPYHYGGGWTAELPAELRSTARASMPKDERVSDVGFRCVWGTR